MGFSFELVLLEEAEGGRMVGRPVREETIWEAETWVPGPGACVEVGARGVPGWAMAGKGGMGIRGKLEVCKREESDGRFAVCSGVGLHG